MHRRWVFIQYVHPDRGRIGIGGFTSVQPGIAGYRFLYQQSAAGQDAFLRHQRDAASGRIKVDVVSIVLPDHGWRWLRSVLHYAGEIYRRAFIDK